MKKVLKTHIWFVVLLLILAIYLGLKTFPEDGWSGWGFGDAATLLNIKHWVKDGFIYNKLLFLPMGYSKTVRYLDEPEMRHQARGTTVGGLIGNRLYYTHYPSGYLIPQALLMKAGFTERHWFRLLALLISLVALVLLYAFFYLIGGKFIASAAVFYYAVSAMFLDYADSLANQPLDDLFRFLLLFLSVLAVRSVDNIKKFLSYNIFIWLFYFLLSLCSYDSHFFVLLWLIALDVITFRKFLWKKWLLFASAPIMAFCLQQLQNFWYLASWQDVWLDITGTAVARIQSSSVLWHGKLVFYTVHLMTGFSIIFAAILVFALFMSLWKFKNEYPFLKRLLPMGLTLFLAGSFYPFILPSSGGFSYQGRQMAPFISLLVAASVYLLYSKRFVLAAIFKDFRKNAALFLFLIICIILWSGQIYRTINYVKDWPNHKVSRQLIDFARSLKQIAGNNDTAIFRLDSMSLSRYPAISFEAEYYMDMPVLSFKRIPDLARDYKWLRNRSEFPFRAIILATTDEEADKIRQLVGGDEYVTILILPDKNLFNN